jgi:hypothetical protein
MVFRKSGKIIKSCFKDAGNLLLGFIGIIIIITAGILKKISRAIATYLIKLLTRTSNRMHIIKIDYKPTLKGSIQIKAKSLYAGNGKQQRRPKPTH